MLYLCVNALDYRATIKLHDIKKTDNIWNQSFQIIVEVIFQLDSVGGENIPPEIRRYWRKQTVKFANPRLGCDV